MIINIRNKKVFQICLFVLVAVVALGIGYAGITAIDLIVNGYGAVSVAQANFLVHFINTSDSPSITDGRGTAFIDDQDDTIAHFGVSGLSKKGDVAVAKYTVKNDSASIGADINLNVTNSNNEYFNISAEILDKQLKAGDTTTAILRIEMIKTPTDSEVSTNITAKIISNPMENALAVGNDGAIVGLHDPVSFATDSWDVIQYAVRNGNTSAYNIGDTKKVTIGGKEYTLRIVNKSEPGECNGMSYSQTACGFIVEFVDIIDVMDNRQVQGTFQQYSNLGGYPDSRVCNYLNGSFYNQLPEDMKKVISTTRIVSGHESWISSDYVIDQKLFLLSGKEIWGEDEQDSSSVLTRQLDYYVDNGEKSIGQVKRCGCDDLCYMVDVTIQLSALKKYNGANYGYWLRSFGSNSAYRSFDSVGQLVSTSYSNSMGVAPAFRIK